MIDALEDVALRELNVEAQRIMSQMPTSRWFLFGSITTAKRPVGDIDLLVVAETSAHCIIVRHELAPLCAAFPIHLLVMTPSEEAELKFTWGVNAVEIFLGEPKISMESSRQ